ncbi:DUF4006 family protein [Campylobacter sp. TTU-622]|uniref:DUF4006 family protein n=1 Tax=unclassified Campylobacter TaxID=2593542 RepID=UPI0019040FFF|nr:MULTISPECIES: DUF4006 family protein [unclassified Campylobacter]MBK1971861.1 DUF4006 family protein [Campylobacter sp. TTU_617]MBK1973841.1 DUF4006 family protein [Campylobacter sp. TTU-622]MBK1991404.1 DUF4006 family protein [Campylobacter sp. 2018MI34]
MENIKRSVFSLSGVSGLLIATLLLIIILVVLTIWGIKAQQEVMQKPYTLKNTQEIKMLGSKVEDFKAIKENNE